MSNPQPKKVGWNSNSQRREVATNLEKDLGKQSTLDGMVKKEPRTLRNQGGSNSSKGGIPKSTSN
jgi:hypothetical protein